MENDFRLQDEVGGGQMIANKRGGGNFSKVECEWRWRTKYERWTQI
jgi:hypothetical protein